VTELRQPHAAAVVLASGAGTRVGSELNKVYLPLAGRPLLAWSLDAFAQVAGIGTLVLVIRPQDAHLAADLAGADVEIVHGGASRQESELNALRHLAARIGDGTIDTVLLHDGARPLIDRALITRVLDAARRNGGAIPALPADDLVTVDESDGRLGGPPPGSMVRVQTPQGFHARPLLEAYERARAENFLGTDTASCMERFSEVTVAAVPGDQRNIKITYPHDLVVAGRVLSS
jgi:2-C-methyl-D-erythritol 4-phosphate cytidylyltransferase